MKQGFRFALVAASMITAYSSVLQADGQQVCGSAENLFQLKHCLPPSSGPWRIDFGKASLPSPPRAQRMTHRGLADLGPARPRTAGHSPLEQAFTRGLNLIRTPAAKDPIDCAMQKRADPTIDPLMVHRVKGHVRHSGIIVWVAPCR